VKRRFRLRKTAEFERVRRSGKSFAHPLIVLVVRENEGDSLQIGITAGRSLGNAVQRNRLKRLMRAAIRTQLGYIRPGHDLLLIARLPMVEASFVEIHSAIQKLLGRADLLTANDD